MPIGFRCTGCRARLHVPKRWSGTTLACPKCGTRVVVPQGSGQAAVSPFEGRSVEQSLAALELVPRGERGGVFAADGFELPAGADPAHEADGGPARRYVALSFPAVYAYLAVVPLVAIVSFLLGWWWAVHRGR